LKVIRLLNTFLIEEGNVKFGFTIKPIDFSFYNSERERNFRKLLKDIRINPFKIFEPIQEHSDRISYVSKGSYEILKTDALYTFEKNLLLTVKTADCFPLFFWNKNTVGIIHCGWRSLKKGIIKNLFKYIRANKTQFFIGPGIRECCYRVGKEFYDFFKDFIDKRNKNLYLSLPKFIISELTKNKVSLKNIIDSKLCTFCREDLFFSYRRGDVKKRMLSFIIRV